MDIDPLNGIPHPFSPIVLAQNVAPPKKSAVQVSSLDKFSDDINPYSAAELNDALLTVFGEIDDRLIPELDKEAHAVASTIFNRLSRIETARKTYDKAKGGVDKAVLVRKEAQRAYDDLVNHPSKYKKELGENKFGEMVAAAKRKYNDTTSALAVAQNAAVKALSEKLAAEAYVDESKRNKQKVTLTDIVELVDQYEGYPRGRTYFTTYSTLSKPDQERNRKRWKFAKKSISELASHPDQRDSYLELRSMKGKSKPSHGRKQIGGNEFW